MSACVLGACASIGCAPSSSSADPSAEPSWLGQGEIVAPWHPSVVRARRASIHGDVTESDPEVLTLELFDDKAVTASGMGLRTGTLGRSWIGVSEGEGTQVVLSVVDGMPAGTVRVADGLFQIVGIDAETALVIERDEAAIEPEGPIVAPAFAPSGAEPVASGGGAGSVAGDAATTVDLMVVYTPQALAGAGSAAAMDALIELAVQETNLGYEASGVDVELRVVHRTETPYDESAFDWSEALSRLRGTSDGFMDEVHELRDAHGADHVVLLVDTVGPYAGIGYQLVHGAAPFFDAWAFSVVARAYATGAYTFGHELGHNMGANHDHDNAQGPGYHPDSHGLQVPSHGYRTIMSYNCDGCARINHWSNPAVSVVGAPTGVVGWADNARTLNETALLTSQFREAASQPWAATLEAPLHGTTLPRTVVSFSWDDTGAAAYQLKIGTADDPARYHDSEPGKNTAALVAGLPHDGSPVVARLSSLLDAGWASTEVIYDAYSAPQGAAVVTHPVPGSLLPAGPVDVRWSYDAQALSHELVVLDDDGQVVASGETPSQALSLTLPCDGAGLHLTLRAQRDDGWTETAVGFGSTGCPP